jgi:long-chain acyl-CoA synthetase
MKYGATTLNLASILEYHARISPDREAIVWNEKRFSYERLNAMANRVANALVEMNIGHNDKVALVCPNLPFFPIVYYGILKAGAVVVPLNVLFKSREFAYHLRDSDAKAVFVFEGTNELPMAQMVKEAFDTIDECEHLIVMTIDPKAASPFENSKTFTEIVAGKSETFETFPTKPEDTCAILYTSGDDRTAERARS